MCHDGGDHAEDVFYINQRHSIEKAAPRVRRTFQRRLRLQISQHEGLESHGKAMQKPQKKNNEIQSKSEKLNKAVAVSEEKFRIASGIFQDTF